MSLVAIADTNILIELYRRDPAAQAWFSTQSQIGVTSISWLEFIEGARGKAGQVYCLKTLEQFSLEYVTASDQQWLMQQLRQYRLSNGVSFKDCMIASVAYRLQIPIYTKNVKDFLPILGKSLVIRPY